MTKFCEVLKIELLSMFGINKLIHQKNNEGKLIGYSLLFLYVVVVMAFVSSYYSYSIAKTMNTIGAVHLVVAIMMAASSAVILLTTIYKASSTLFIYSDYDVVMSLPVKTTTVILSRFTVLYFLSLALMMLLLIPAFVVYSIFTGFSVLKLLSFIVGLCFVPFIPIVIATLIGMAIALISSKFKISNTVNLFLMFLTVFGIMGISALVSFNSPTITDTQFLDLTKMMSDSIYRMYPLTQMFTKGVCLGDVISLVGFVTISAVMFVLFVYLVSFKYKNICTALSSKRTSRNYKLTELKGDSVFSALYKKELKRYFSSTIYVFNTSFGAIMLVIAAIASIFVKIDAIPEVKPLIDMMLPFLPIGMAIMVGTVCTSGCSISLEGKNFWIPKTLPVAASSVYYSKIAVNLTVTVPIIIVTGIFITIGLNLNFLNAMMLFVTAIAFTLFVSVLGLFVNIKMPSFDWKNDTAVVKQSASAMISILLPLVIGMLLGVVTYFVPSAVTTFVIDAVLLLATFVINKTIQKIPLNKIQ